MLNNLRKFRADEDGAVTVDWVVLTAVIISLSLAVVSSLVGATTDRADTVGAFLSTHEGLEF